MALHFNGPVIMPKFLARIVFCAVCLAGFLLTSLAQAAPASGPSSRPGGRRASRPAAKRAAQPSPQLTSMPPASQPTSQPASKPALQTPSLPADALALAPWSGTGNFIDYYQSLSARGDAPLITVDAAFWALQRLREQTLGAMEVEFILPRLSQTLELAAAQSQQIKPPQALAEPLRQLRLYLAVARALLDPKAEIPQDLAETANQELARIEAHEGFLFSSVLDQKMDYSQMRPRGRYTLTEELKRYFLAQMWLSRTIFRLDEKHPDGAGIPLDHPELKGWFPPDSEALAAKGDPKALEELAKRFPPQGLSEMRAAALLAVCLNQAEPGKESGRRLAQEIDEACEWLFGPSDDAGLSEAYEGLEAVFGAVPKPDDLANDSKMLQWAAWLSQKTQPKIDSTGLGRRGLSFLGQRSVLDSQILQMMVAGDDWTARYAPQPSGTQEPFTLVRDDLRGPLRGFPRGLDLFAAAGSELAANLLKEKNDAAYEGFAERAAQAAKAWKAHFAAEQTARLSLYDEALAAAAAMAQPSSDARGPAWMRTERYTRLRLNSALGAWAALRHEAILYAKQSSTGAVRSAFRFGEKGQSAYVEPRPEIYKRLAGAAGRMVEFAEARSAALPEPLPKNARAVRDLLSRLEAVSRAELEDAAIEPADAQMIGGFGDALRSALELPADFASRIAFDLKAPAPVVADVHTRTPDCLEEGVGHLWEMTAAVGEGGQARALKGAVGSYYEFRQPIQKRLTDEEWRQMLAESKAPAPLLIQEAKP